MLEKIKLYFDSFKIRKSFINTIKEVSNIKNSEFNKLKLKVNKDYSIIYTQVNLDEANFQLSPEINRQYVLDYLKPAIYYLNEVLFLGELLTLKIEQFYEKDTLNPTMSFGVLFEYAPPLSKKWINIITVGLIFGGVLGVTLISFLVYYLIK